jgi:hypothetical protein
VGTNGLRDDHAGVFDDVTGEGSPGAWLADRSRCSRWRELHDVGVNGGDAEGAGHRHAMVAVTHEVLITDPVDRDGG